MIHRSKKETWLMLTLALAIILPLALGAFLLITTPTQIAGWLLIAIGIAVGIFIPWLMTPLYYEITQSELNVRSGPMRWTIPLKFVNEVYLTRSPLSSPALSLDRLLIRYENGKGPSALMISPEDNTAFLQELALAEPRLKLVGNALKKSEGHPAG
jgi:Bacterial PH domain